MNEFVHTTLGVCFWDIPALIVLIAIIVVFVVHVVKQNRREKEFEDELAERSANSTTENRERV